MLDNNLYHYSFTLIRVIDGDTIVGNIDLGFNTIRMNQHIRLVDINTPEIRGEHKQLGLQIKQIVHNLLLDTSIIIKSNDVDSFGRILAEVYYQPIHSDEWINLNQQLLNEGYALPYV